MITPPRWRAQLLRPQESREHVAEAEDGRDRHPRASAATVDEIERTLRRCGRLEI